MKQFKSLALIATVGLSIAACSAQKSIAPEAIVAVSKPQTTTPTLSPWERRQLKMGAMQSWDMTGRAALKFNGDGWTFGLNWLQKNKQQYVLQIKNPITGTVLAQLEQSPGKAVLKAQGKVHQGADAERLLEDQMRVKMPVNGMPYWVRGVMAPQYALGKVKLDAAGRPTQITQEGWVIDYSQYQDGDFAALPGKVNISRQQDKVNVRILAKKWQVR
ncbi:lipoprotein insertase outer membrane protein LolB [Leucothrix arctica]|uniref:Outer-membrane lipoprotein LolB n=1 Tax=Leucothrix arctica TaxID=1481894 RepID=A0A317CK04_9GAMM|nr:lipoprotein insertase outer membrane protein LolB [Leucothrix arctica]PWQ98925.1 outer membrane lipoprotein LolB [Leucothrix arctica]